MMPKPHNIASEVFEQERLLKRMRTERDAAATQGDHGLALTLNDRIDDVKAGRLSVERAMRVFQRGLKMRREFGEIDLARKGVKAMKKRGPGRPKGSKNKPKPGRPKGSKTKRLRPSVAARHAIPPPKRSRGRPRKAVIPASIGDLERLNNGVLDVMRIQERIGDEIAELQIRVEALTADHEHPNMRALAERLVTLEGRDTVAGEFDDRIKRVEAMVGTVRDDMNQMIKEQHEARNLAEVQKIATDPDQPEFFNEDQNGNEQPTRAAE